MFRVPYDRICLTCCGKISKVKFSLCLIKHLTIKTYLGVEIYLYSFLTSALDGGEWLALWSGRFKLVFHKEFAVFNKMKAAHFLLLLKLWSSSTKSAFTHSHQYFEWDPNPRLSNTRPKVHDCSPVSFLFNVRNVEKQ
jgi:hypothetical protein